MKMISRGATALLMILVFAPLIHGQDLSKYRNFSFGMSLAAVSKQVDLAPAEVKSDPSKASVDSRVDLVSPATFWHLTPGGTRRENSLFVR